MNLRSLSVLAASALIAFAETASAWAPMIAPCSGAQEVPPNASPGVGDGRFIIDTATNTLYYHITYSGLMGAETAAHIHGYAPPGVNAGVVHALPSGSPKIGAWSYPAGNEAQILGGLTYVNIHTSMFPGGEIRGQIVADPSTDMVALCDGAQEVPPNASPGLGIGFFDIDTGANTLSYDIRFGNLLSAESAAHIHAGAPGVAGGVLHALPLGSPKVGTWNYAEAQEANILGGLTYVNIHSGMFPGGEIRGQIVLPNPATDAPQLPAHAGPGLSLVAAPNPVPAGRGDVALFYRVPSAGEIKVVVHDVAGRTVRTVFAGRAAASGILAWDGRDDAGASVAAGVYFARIEAAGASETRPITVVK